VLVKLRNIIREVFIKIRYLYLVKLYGMNIDKTAKISFSAKLDKTNPKGIFIGAQTYIAGGG